MSSFSERKGLKPFKVDIQYDEMSVALRNSIWNVLDIFIWQQSSYSVDRFSSALWIFYFKSPADERPTQTDYAGRVSWGFTQQRIRDYFFAAKWNEIYDFIEFVLNDDPCDDNITLAENLNFVLEAELSAYRIVANKVTDITSEQEISLLADALNDDQFSGVTAHLRQAFQLYADRKNPDYRNSIKESISAVEAMAKIMTGLSNATLGDALRRLEKDNLLKPSLKAGFEKLYAYTNDKNGIRHAMLEETKISASEAQFFLLSCTSFVNYLKSLMH